MSQNIRRSLVSPGLHERLPTQGIRYPTPSPITMKVLLFIALFTPMVLCYDTKHDSFDVDKLLADETQFDTYVKCMLDKGPCSIESSDIFRERLPEVVSTACEKCSDVQKANVRKLIKAIQERKPTDFNDFMAKYDPKGEHAQTFAAFIVGSE